jgi:hypothetical protein
MTLAYARWADFSYLFKDDRTTCSWISGLLEVAANADMRDAVPGKSAACSIAKE